MADQPALGQDGQLLDATEIEWYHDPDDAWPIPPSSHLQEGQCSRPAWATTGGRLAAALAAEKLDEYGNPVMSFRRRVTQPLKPRAITKRKRATVDDAETDVEDENFVDSSTEDGLDTDIDLVEISNEEVANILPSKTIPEVSGKGHTRTLKATTNSRMTTTPLKKKILNTKLSQMHPMVLQETLETFTTVFSWHSQADVSAVLYPQRSDVPPTPDEIAIASGKKRLDGKTEAEYFKKLKMNLKTSRKHLKSNKPEPMYVKIIPFTTLDSSMAHSTGAWDQEKFEQVLTEWIIACDQPFNEVEKQEFVTMMNLIPKRDGIKRRVMKMGDEIIEGVCEMFMKLKGKIIAIVMDNASNNNTLMTSLEWRCEEPGYDFPHKKLACGACPIRFIWQPLRY
ncbi:hypothetical protein BC826DRAFT_974203 [Russula brevipes]|nr:hypothetical protein BC826DRAFT_974203 [Russula brevipes]